MCIRDRVQTPLEDGSKCILSPIHTFEAPVSTGLEGISFICALADNPEEQPNAFVTKKAFVLPPERLRCV